MSMPDKRKVAAVCGDGHIRLLEQDIPPLKAGAVLVEVHASLVSPGTELGGWQNLSARRNSPDSEVKPRPFGYSNAGIVMEAGQGVADFKSGDRVACVGGNYVMHADYAVVPQNLCVRLPETVTFIQGSYAMLMATSLHALRRGTPEFGESIAVVGLGIVGHLAARMYQLAGNFVIGWDTNPFRTALARKCGVDVTVTVGDEDEIEATKRFTNGYGLDAAVLAFGGDGNKAMESVMKCMKCSPDGHLMGRIVIVGSPQFEYNPATTNIDIRRAARTGPGYHDEAWEFGADYPPVFMRWTTRTNLELCMRLISEGRLNVDALTTHTIPLDRADEEISAILDVPDSILGVVFVREE